MYASWSKLSKELNNVIDILIGQAVFKQFLNYWSKQSKYCFDQLLKNCLAYLNVNATS